MKLPFSVAVLALASGVTMTQEPKKPPTPSTPAASQPQFDYKPSAEESVLLQLSQEWMDAALRGKEEKRLREIMAPEFTLQLWDASRAPQPLEAWLAAAPPNNRFRKFLALGTNRRGSSRFT